jgi:hypothetical protein
MRKTFRYRQAWPLQLLLAGLIVWLAQSIWIQRHNFFGVLYAQGQRDRTPVMIERAPLRFIRDPNPNLSAVAVNSEQNMLVVADENLFQIMEYDPKTNTPPQARFSEPKRVISGTNTTFEMSCGVYLDPKNQEILVLNGNTHN